MQVPRLVRSADSLGMTAVVEGSWYPARDAMNRITNGHPTV